MLPALFVFISLQMESLLCLDQLDCNPPIYASYIAGVTGMCYQTQFLLVEMGSYELFAQAGLQPPSSELSLFCS
jgi:hypothetical protein